MTKFEPVQAGLAAKIADEERARWQEVFAKIPAARHKMATILLGAPGAHITTAEIITACNVAASPLATGDTSITAGKQALFEQGVTTAAQLLGKPVPAVIPEAYPATAREFHLDPALYAAGADMAKALKPFLANAR
jgi:hypothetical protein